jgi:hypothetical protein
MKKGEARLFKPGHNDGRQWSGTQDAMSIGARISGAKYRAVNVSITILQTGETERAALVQCLEEAGEGDETDES